MGKSTRLSVVVMRSCLLLLVLVSGCLGNEGGRRRRSQRGEYGQGNECQFDRLTALEPSYRIEAEAGLTEVWDSQDQQFQCSGVSVIRRTIEPNGLLLPSFVSSPELVYIEQGNGLSALLVPGCPETFESMSQQQFGEEEQMDRGERQRRERGSERGERFQQDQHQKIRRIRQGDILALPAGVAHWAYNNGQEPLVAIILIDSSNQANQLDKDFPRRFYLAGSPQQEHSSRKGERPSKQGGNVFTEMESKTLSELFEVSEEIVRKLQADQDDRGNIVKVQEGLHVIKPPSRSYDEERGEQTRRHRSRDANGVEETLCSARLTSNIDDPAKADFYNPEAGRFTTLNSFNLPILRSLRLGAAKGHLYRNAIMTPHYYLNAHSIIYGTQGRGRIQIVNDQGKSVFDDELRQGQLVVLPQNFAIVVQAQEEGFEWVSFRTSDNTLFQSLAGRTSAIRALPVDVVSNIYQISREEASRLKYSRSESILFRPSSQQSRKREIDA